MPGFKTRPCSARSPRWQYTKSTLASSSFATLAPSAAFALFSSFMAFNFACTAPGIPLGFVSLTHAESKPRLTTSALYFAPDTTCRCSEATLAACLSAFFARRSSICSGVSSFLAFFFFFFPPCAWLAWLVRALSSAGNPCESSFRRCFSTALTLLGSKVLPLILQTRTGLPPFWNWICVPFTFWNCPLVLPCSALTVPSAAALVCALFFFAIVTLREDQGGRGRTQRATGTARKKNPD
mmetsp:Transcript_18129/g.49741  ORF Transcript_18129/g.49741 Transcript_18129/m.49741 type:complete len:239 (-) Transcript_18129:36-752(-)